MPLIMLILIDMFLLVFFAVLATATEHLNEINQIFRKRHRDSENSRNVRPFMN